MTTGAFSNDWVTGSSCIANATVQPRISARSRDQRRSHRHWSRRGVRRILRPALPLVVRVVVTSLGRLVAQADGETSSSAARSGWIVAALCLVRQCLHTLLTE